MKFGLLYGFRQRPGPSMIKATCTQKSVAARVLCFIIILVVFLGFYPGTGHTSSENKLPLPIKDNSFGMRCPPGFCQIPQGILMGLRDMALGVHFIDKNKGWIVGNSGFCVKTGDSGQSWEKVAFPDDESYKDVFFVGDKGWIVGELGVILHTADGGQNWKKQVSNTKKSLLKVFFINSHIGFVVGGDGTILRTENSGSSWESIDVEWEMIISEELLELGVVSINLYDVFFLNDTQGWIVGDAGTVLHSLDGGKQWNVVHMGPVPPLFSVFFKNDKDGFAVGSHGYSLKTQDGGQNWEKFKTGTENSLYKVVFEKEIGVAVGDLATIVKTVDGGSTWVEVPSNLPPPYPWFADVWLLKGDSMTAISVGQSIILDMDITTKR